MKAASIAATADQVFPQAEIGEEPEDRHDDQRFGQHLGHQQKAAKRVRPFQRNIEIV